MDNRKWQANAKASPPTPPASPSVGYPGNGGVSDPPTTPGEWQWYALTEEVRNVIVGGGLTPDNTLNQMLTAIKNGFGKTWQVLTGSRALNTTYTNSTGSEISVNVYLNSNVSSYTSVAAINGVQMVFGSSGFAPGIGIGIYFQVPAGATYSVGVTNGTPSLGGWSEYR